MTEEQQLYLPDDATPELRARAYAQAVRWNEDDFRQFCQALAAALVDRGVDGALCQWVGDLGCGDRPPPRPVCAGQRPG